MGMLKVKISMLVQMIYNLTAKWIASEMMRDELRTREIWKNIDTDLD